MYTPTDKQHKEKMAKEALDKRPVVADGKRPPVMGLGAEGYHEESGILGINTMKVNIGLASNPSPYGKLLAWGTGGHGELSYKSSSAKINFSAVKTVEDIKTILKAMDVAFNWVGDMPERYREAYSKGLIKKE